MALIGAAPEEVAWRVGASADDLFGAPAPAPLAPAGLFSVPRAFIELARRVIRHPDPERFALLYALLVRLRERPDALRDKADALVQRVAAMARSVRRDGRDRSAFPQFGKASRGD